MPHADEPPPHEIPKNSVHPLPWKTLAPVSLLGVLAIVFPKVSFPAAMLCLIGGLSLPRLEGRAKRLSRTVLALAGLGAAVGVARFVLLEALPGVIAGGSAAVEKHAVAAVRGIVVAQDYARRSALRDPDGDGVGSALFLGELGGYQPVGPHFPQETPPLAFARGDLLDSREGEALRKSGYLFQLCLPLVETGFSAQRNPAVSDEISERRYLIYAWPEIAGKGRPNTVYFADEHERILQFANADGAYAGLSSPPPCASALEQEGWERWKDKLPKAHLVGERGPSAPRR